MAGELGKETSELVSKMVDVMTQLALTNQNLSRMGGELELHNKLIYGNDEGKGGILLMVNDHDKLLNDPNTGLVHQVQEFVTHCNKFIAATEGRMEGNDRSIRNLNRVVYSIAGILTFILISLGVFGYREIITLVQAAGL